MVEEYRRFKEVEGLPEASIYEAIRIGDIHLDRNTIATRNRKAGPVVGRTYDGIIIYTLRGQDGPVS